MVNINDDTIELILSEKFDESRWLFELGRVEANGTQGIDSENQFMNSFFDAGKRVWQKYESTLKGYMCDNSTNEPKNAIKELIDGNVKEAITNIIGTLVSNYDMAIGLAIPMCALILKKGIHKICAA